MPKKKGPAPAKDAHESMTTRERILSSALEVFAERGLYGATMTQIAERAGLTGGALYRYFPNKDEVFRAVVDSRSTAFSALDMVRGLIPELEPRAALNFIAQGMFAFFLSEKDFMRMVVAESVKDPAKSRPFFEKMLDPARGFLADCMAAWKEKGLLRQDIDPGVATMAFLGTVGYALVEKGLLEDPHLQADVGPLAENLCDVFLNGILAGG